MTDQEGNRWYYLTRGIQGGLEKWCVARGERGWQAIFQTPLNLENLVQYPCHPKN